MSGIDAFGTAWSFSTDGGTTFTVVAKVTNVGVLDAKADTIDVSSHDSTAGWREFVGGMKDGGELQMLVNYDPTAHSTILTHIGGAPLEHKVTLSDAGPHIVAFNGIITGLKALAPFDDKLQATITVKVSGAPTITP